MPLNNEQVKNIKEILKNTIRNKFSKYNPETSNMPFHTSLLGRDRLALYSFIQSLNTTFGTSIFKTVAVEIAKSNFKIVEKQYTVGSKVSIEAQREIQNIINSLTTGKSTPNKDEEIKKIKSVSTNGKIQEVKHVKVGLYLLSDDNEYYLIDLKTAKPNMDEFKGYKRTLLEWVASLSFIDKNAHINTLIAIPYNPYEPEPYQRWTMKGMLDLDKELKVASEFWDFLGGENTYGELLKCFQDVGIEMRDEIDNYFSKFNK